MTKHTILLVYGGESSEHEVSILSAHNVYAALDDDKYNVVLCYIDKSGRWWLTESIDGAHIGHPQLLPVFGQRKFLVSPGDKTLRPDVILPILHGKNGEDGTIQAVAEMLHIPCVGPNLLGAAVTMEKDMTKRLLRDAGIPVVPWLVWRVGEDKPRYRDVAQLLGEIVFVKPSRAGSSIGVSRVASQSELREALEEAAKYDSIVLIEKAVIGGGEFQIAVLGNNNPKVSDICEIVIGADFHDFKDKYDPNTAARFYIPARVKDDVKQELQNYATDAFRATGGWGMARIDFFIDENHEIYLNEINSIPGFTSASVYPRLWHESGLGYGRLIDELIVLALENKV